jgi:uncharacterized BrkB/YihY/UPF0761 family membrane protein
MNKSLRIPKNMEIYLSTMYSIDWRRRMFEWALLSLLSLLSLLLLSLLFFSFTENIPKASSPHD